MSEPRTPFLRRTDRDGIATLTLDRPDRLNALSSGMLEALRAEIAKLHDDASARVVVLSGAGKHFCAGHDLAEMRANPSPEFQEALFGACREVMTALVALPQPVIARVQGAAVAAGCQLVATCDMAVAADVATFALPGIRAGIFCTTPGVAVARNLARKRAFELLVTGDSVDAATAERWGLVNRVVPSAELDAEVDRLARKVASHSPAVVALGKRLFYRQVDEPLAEAYATASEGMVCNMGLEDAAEGIDAFLARRPPAWRGR
jgi:enoyl-CoA hydratase/carnithine racemase